MEIVFYSCREQPVTHTRDITTKLNAGEIGADEIEQMLY